MVDRPFSTIHARARARAHTHTHTHTHLHTTDYATPPPSSHHLVLRPQVLELRKGSIAQARSNFQASQRIAPYMFESFFNGGERSRVMGVRLRVRVEDKVDNTLVGFTHLDPPRNHHHPRILLCYFICDDWEMCINMTQYVALLAYKLGNHQESYKLVSKSLQAYPNHSDSKDLQGQLKSLFTML